MAAQVCSYVYRELLRHANVVVSMWASCYFGDFCVGAMNYLVANATNSSLTAFDAGQLFHE
jgi:hypothetical protein